MIDSLGSKPPKPLQPGEQNYPYSSTFGIFFQSALVGWPSDIFPFFLTWFWFENSYNREELQSEGIVGGMC